MPSWSLAQFRPMPCFSCLSHYSAIDWLGVPTGLFIVGRGNPNPYGRPLQILVTQGTSVTMVWVPISLPGPWTPLAGSRAVLWWHSLLVESTDQKVWCRAGCGRLDFVSGFDANLPPERSYEYRFVHRCSAPGMSLVCDRVLSTIPLTWVRASERIWLDLAAGVAA